MKEKTESAKKRYGTCAAILIAASALALFLLTGCDNVSSGAAFTAGPATAEEVPGTMTDAPESEAPATMKPTENPTETPEGTPEITFSPTPAATPVFPQNEYDITSGTSEYNIFVEMLPEPEKEILTVSGICDANARMISESDTLVDILEMPLKLSRDGLIEMISSSSVPSLPLYDRDGNEISEEQYRQIISNTCLENIRDENFVLPGIVVRRADLKRLPTDLEFHSAPGTAVDRIQDTELYYAMPVWVLWQSADREFYFVRSYWYCGWTRAENVAIAFDYDQWSVFADPEQFVIVTESKINVEGEQLDMGVKLPFVSLSDDGTRFTVELPVSEGGGLQVKTAEISVYEAHRGYLKYTYVNFIVQAMKFIGTEYQWGGLNGGVDCSSYVASVMRSFGFMFPRDTKDQNSVVGKPVDTAGMTSEGIKELIEEEGQKAPVAMYKKGHVRFYLGTLNGAVTVIHAPGSNKTVTVETIDNFDDIIYVCPLVG